MRFQKAAAILEPFEIALCYRDINNTDLPCVLPEARRDISPRIARNRLDKRSLRGIPGPVLEHPLMSLSRTLKMRFEYCASASWTDSWIRQCQL